MRTSQSKTSSGSPVSSPPDVSKEAKAGIPVGLAAEKALGLDEGILQFFPPTSRMSYGPRMPWTSISNRAGDEAKRPKPVVRLGVL